MLNAIQNLHNSFVGYKFSNDKIEFTITSDVPISEIFDTIFCNDVKNEKSPADRKDKLTYLLSVLGLIYVEHFGINLNDSYEFSIKY